MKCSEETADWGSGQNEITPGRKRERQGKIILFTGSTPNIGTTFVAAGAASRLAMRSAQPVGYICLNLKSSKLLRYSGSEGTASVLDSVRAEMRSGCLNPHRLKSFFEPVKGCPNLRILYGTLQREQAEFYLPADIRHLLDAVRQAFGVCLIEVSAYWDNAATIITAMEADERIVVTTSELGHFQEDLERGLKTVAPMFDIRPESFLLAVNQYQADRTGGIKASDIRKEAGMELAAVIPYDPGLREWLNQGRLWEYAGSSKAFVQAIDPLADVLAERVGLEKRTETARPGFIRSWMPILNGR
jgi:Flp pilus assembly CpaE family ATPase